MNRNDGRIRVLLLMTLIGSMTTSSWAAPSKEQAKLNGGYYLLYKLAGDEDQLPLLLDIKHAPPELKDYAIKISQMGKETKGAIEKFQDHDKAIQFDRNPLPEIEQDVRDSIKGDKQHQLVFGTSNNEFVRALAISQIEATTYGTNFCKVLADQETDPGRVKVLQRLSAKWLALRNQAFSILRNY